MTDNNAKPFLTLRGIAKEYQLGKTVVPALQGVDLDVERGEFTVVMGPSGSGKSTLLNIIGCLDCPTRGTYQLDDREVGNRDFDKLASLRNEKIGFIFQSFNLIPDLNVFDNVDVPLRYRRLPGAERRKRITESLERVGLSARAKHYPAELSGGQQQRVAIARALAGGPRLLLADEPTGNLDSQMARGVMQLLEELHRDGATIVMVTHDPELAARAQREVRIVDGQVIDLAAQTRLVETPDTRPAV